MTGMFELSNRWAVTTEPWRVVEDHDHDSALGEEFGGTRC